jgi:hypothetical protein
MNHPAAVRIAQRLGHFAGELEGLFQGKLPLALQPVAEGLALDEGHDVEEEVGQAVRRLGGQ